ncbi:MAG: aminopeptidase P family protein [Flavobacteriales bacterium]
MSPRWHFLLSLALALPVRAQELPGHPVLQQVDAVDTDKLGPDFHLGRREALRVLLPAHGVAVLGAATVKNRSNDVDYEFHQDPDFHYLTGVDEPGALLLVFKEPRMVRGEPVNELLVVRDRDPKAEVWTGTRLGADGAKAVSGVGMALGAQAFSATENVLLPTDTLLGIPGDAGNEASKALGLEKRRIDASRLGGLMATLRQAKLPAEIELMRKAIDITCAAERTLMRLLKPGMTEFQAEAIVQYVFTNAGAEHEGYPSILGGGEHSCVLHYEANRKTLRAGDLLVSDVGAEYHGYTADVTRTLPVSGTFTREQKLIYELELKAQEAGIAEVKAGNPFHAPHYAATAVIAAGLKALGIIKEDGEVKRYFMHGTSHYLGLDVHDAGHYGPLKAGEVITVEPGIYIPAGSPCDPKWWNIGVRIEDDVLVTSGAPEVLSACVPKTVAEVEAAMREEPRPGDVPK